MKTRAYVALIFAAVAAVAILVIVLLGIGRFDPSPPSLRSRPVPAIPGEILYVDADGCIIRARASGESREAVICPGPDTSIVSWIDGETIGWAEYSAGQPTWTVLALGTRTITVSDTYAQPQPSSAVSPRGERAGFDRDGSLYRITDGERTKIFDFDGPEHRQPSLVTWSPDGEWLLLQYENALWIVSRDGSVQGTLARTRPWAQGASWWIDGIGYLPTVTLSDSPIPPGGPAPVAALTATPATPTSR